MRAIVLLAISAALSGAHVGVTCPTRADDEAVWAALKSGGHVALIRHALAPGFGDPENFSLDDPKTQRNLSAEGRAQAKAHRRCVHQAHHPESPGLLQPVASLHGYRRPAGPRPGYARAHT